MVFLEPLLQLLRELLIALLTDRLLIKLKELCLLRHLGVTRGAGKVVLAPGLVESRHNISIDHSVANEAQVSKQLMVMGFTIGQSLAFIMAVPHEGLFTLGAHKMLHVPMLP